MAMIERDVGAAAAELLDAPEPPDALVTAPEDGAVGALRAARARGFAVPADLLVASCVDSSAMAACDPPITAIDLRPQELGRTAARVLARVLDGRAPGGTPELIPTTLVVRRSTLRRVAG
jgi:DNA-binding LacI/PurR family transcriptional regulator